MEEEDGRGSGKRGGKRKRKARREEESVRRGEKKKVEEEEGRGSRNGRRGEKVKWTRTVCRNAGESGG